MGRFTVQFLDLEDQPVGERFEVGDLESDININGGRVQATVGGLEIRDDNGDLLYIHHFPAKMANP